MGTKGRMAAPGEAAGDSGDDMEEKDFFCDIWALWHKQRPEHSVVIDQFDWRLIKHTIEVCCRAARGARGAAHGTIFEETASRRTPCPDAARATRGCAGARLLGGRKLPLGPGEAAGARGHRTRSLGDERRSRRRVSRPS